MRMSLSQRRHSAQGAKKIACRCAMTSVYCVQCLKNVVSPHRPTTDGPLAARQEAETVQPQHPAYLSLECTSFPQKWNPDPCRKFRRILSRVGTRKPNASLTPANLLSKWTRRQRSPSPSEHSRATRETRAKCIVLGSSQHSPRPGECNSATWETTNDVASDEHGVNVLGPCSGSSQISRGCTLPDH